MASPRKPGPGRPKGSLNKRTLEIGGPLDQQKRKVTRALMNEIASDRELAVLMWLCALKAKNDPRYIPAMLAVAERKWGRVKFELDHQGPEEIVITIGKLDLEYGPVGVVPGMERFMPPGRRVKLLPPGDPKLPAAPSDPEPSEPDEK